MGVAWSLTKSKDEKCFVSGFDELQWYHMVGIVAGIVVCVCAVFAIATFLGNMTPILLYVVRILISCIRLLLESLPLSLSLFTL